MLKFTPNPNLHLQPPQEGLRSDFYLWQVFHLEHDIEKARKQAHRHQAEASHLERARGIAENEVRAALRASAEAHHPGLRVKGSRLAQGLFIQARVTSK